MKNTKNKKKGSVTNIIDSYIAEKLLIDESSEHDNLGFPDVNSGMTTGNDTNETK